MKSAFRLFLLSFVFTTTGGSFVYADARDEFYTLGGWDTGEESRNVNGFPRQNCFLKTSFNNGFLMHMHGSEDWVSTIDIDFKQDVFEEGSIHDVAITVPGEHRTELPAKASSKRILSLDVSGDDDVYTHMRNAGLMDFSLDGNDFRFTLAGLSNAAPEFEKCMARSRVMSVSNRSAKPVIYDPDKPALKPKTAAEKREEILEQASDAPFVENTLPTMTLKRRERRRFSEVIAEEIDKNPVMIDENLKKPLPSEFQPSRPGKAVGGGDLKKPKRRKKFIERSAEEWGNPIAKTLSKREQRSRDALKSYRKSGGNPPKDLLVPPGANYTPSEDSE